MSVTLTLRTIALENTNSQFIESDILEDSGILAAVDLAGAKTVQYWYGSYATENAGVYTTQQAFYMELLLTAANDVTVLASIPAFTARMAALSNPYTVFTWAHSVSYG